MPDTEIQPSRANPQNRRQSRATGENLVAMARAWLAGDRDWRPPEDGCAELWRQARKHGTDGIAGALVSAGAQFPDDFRSRAFASYCSNTMHFLQALAVCRKIREAAQLEGIPFSFVKGPALASAYGDDGIRGFGDLDVLVRNGDDARRLAASCGFVIPPGWREVPSSAARRLHGIGRLETDAGPFTVELAFGSLAANEPLHSLCCHWADRYLLPPGGADPFPVPSAEAHLLFLLQHLGLHWCSRLIWLVDFAVIMRRNNFDSDWLEQAAARLEMRRLLRAVTVFCHRHLDEAVGELGRGPTGWKDGLFLSLISPPGLVKGTFHKYNHDSAPRVPDFFLGVFEHVFATDALLPSFSARRTAPRWTGAWLQHVVKPGGRMMVLVGLWVTPLLFLAMTALVCALLKQSPAALLRMGRRELSAGRERLEIDGT